MTHLPHAQESKATNLNVFIQDSLKTRKNTLNYLKKHKLPRALRHSPDVLKLVLWSILYQRNAM